MNKKNHYPNWLVSFEIAKLLKEIDFYDYCYFFYNFNKYDKVENICNITLGCEYVSERDTLLPTWEQVFEWFRSKGYHGVIAVRDQDGDNEYSYCIDYLNELSSDFEQDSHLTYEEAREALVKALIQTYKQEQPINENE
ncbi:hypothetical protein [Capnocytophaga leadbetteri]|mgnify:CR=1 FL=1|uniref:hypothetical protein n=1 Tax=Capnocytophaga leadbetteri TaxID=327575 RepID=UPI0026EEDBA9|nr:hypothetical protein [Capnocytophaga leadbetteri]